MKTLVRSFVVSAFCLAPLALGCSSSTTASSGTDTETADSTEAVASSSQTSRFDEMIFSGVSSTDPLNAAANVAAAQWWPAGCATRTRDATNKAVVHITLNDCTGPFGLVHHTGDITVTFSKGASGGLHAEAASSNMTVNGKAVTYAASADITIDAAAKTISVAYDGAWTRENAKGETVSHTRQGTTVIDLAKRCRDTNGTAVTKVGAREVDSDIKNYGICRKADGSDACPTGEVLHTAKLSGRTLTIDFDGSAQAKVTGPNGNSVEVPLVCTP